MKTEPGRSDEFLGRRLKEWRVDSPLPPRFQEQVWRRIEQADAPGEGLTLWQVLQQLAARLLPHRAWAASYVAVALSAGLVLGYWHGQKDANSAGASLGRQYVQSLDPYQKLGH